MGIQGNCVLNIHDIYRVQYLSRGITVIFEYASFPWLYYLQTFQFFVPKAACSRESLTVAHLKYTLLM